MTITKILFWMFFGLWCASFILWVVGISVPRLRYKRMFIWTLIPVNICNMGVLITSVLL